MLASTVTSVLNELSTWRGMFAQWITVASFDQPRDSPGMFRSQKVVRHFEKKPIKAPLQNFKTHLHYELHEASKSDKV